MAVMAESSSVGRRALAGLLGAGPEPRTVRLVTGDPGTLKLWMLTEVTNIDGTPGEAAVLVWADDPDEARQLLHDRTGKSARVCTEIEPARGVAALIGIRPPGEAAR